MSITYPSLTETVFPDEIDSFVRMRDVSNETDLQNIATYQGYITRKEFDRAADMIDDPEDESFAQMIFNAQKFNKLSDAVLALENMFEDRGWTNTDAAQMAFYAAYNDQKVYNQNDCLFYGGAIWRCVQATAGVAPGTNSAYWVMLWPANYGVCLTDASEANKTVDNVGSGDAITLVAGVSILVKFSAANTASAPPTLSVNGSTAKPIMSYGSTAATSWSAGQIVTLVYDGTNWVMSGSDSYTKSEMMSSNTADTVNSLSGTTPSTPDAALNAISTAAKKTAHPYCTCATSAGTQTKVALVNADSYNGTFTLAAGAVIHVKFTNANTHATPKLYVRSVNGTNTSSYEIWAGTTSVGSGAWIAGQVVTFVFDGEHWQMVGVAKPYVVSANAPSDVSKLWIDTANGLKYYNGSAWVVVPVAYS